MILALALWGSPALADDETLLNRPDAPVQLRLGGEIGFLAVLAHKIQFGGEGSNIDYVKEGGQDNLFAAVRLQAEVRSKRHSVILLYQPLDIQSDEIARRDLAVDGLVFPEGTPMQFRYRFPYYRASWMYDTAKRYDLEVSLGASLQIRNARIDFTSLNGDLKRSNRNIGPVPVLKARIRKDFDNGWFVGGEADGFYAPIKYINGSDNDVEGAILDASLNFGRPVRPGAEFFFNLRYIGGGASGTSSNPSNFTDGYTRNWLNFMVVSLGATVF
ncbi:MAG: hypothetical protein AB8H79_17340 [Myxococcota bacterium]